MKNIDSLILCPVIMKTIYVYLIEFVKLLNQKLNDARVDLKQFIGDRCDDSFGHNVLIVGNRN